MRSPRDRPVHASRTVATSSDCAQPGCTPDTSCLTLPAFGTSAHAELLVAYLVRSLDRPELDYDQTSALGAQLHFDATHRTDRADHFLTPDRLWTQAHSHRRELEPAECRETMTRFSSFVKEAARHWAAGGGR
ncbi:DUF6000 family protein [Streptomyces sp. BBFR25]|uniref:DUF6000 family protein n=1 Tax=Streptomyces sp. BBFR25 TaxID=3372855 RepID=UPI0037DCEC46